MKNGAIYDMRALLRSKLKVEYWNSCIQAKIYTTKASTSTYLKKLIHGN